MLDFCKIVRNIIVTTSNALLHTACEPRKQGKLNFSNPKEIFDQTFDFSVLRFSDNRFGTQELTLWHTHFHNSLNQENQCCKFGVVCL